MRIFRDFAEAQNEIKRDLAELSIEVHPETMQDKVVKGDPDYNTKELYNYAYMVTYPNPISIVGVHGDWATQEWLDRVQGVENPGNAWKLRPEVWEEFLHDGKFHYFYAERMGGKYIEEVIDELRKHPHSRQLWLPVWWATDGLYRGVARVPCSLGYWLVQRGGKVNMTYVMRSCDFATHFPNDVWLASMLQGHIAYHAGYEVGNFTHFVGSLHVYAKDVAGVF